MLFIVVINRDQFVILLWGSNEGTFPSFSSASSFDDIVPVEDVRAILLMSPKINKQLINIHTPCALLNGWRKKQWNSPLWQIINDIFRCMFLSICYTNKVFTHSCWHWETPGRRLLQCCHRSLLNPTTCGLVLQITNGQRVIFKNYCPTDTGFLG